MSGFGDKLREEREARGRSIEDISAATGIHPSYLEALEKEEFHALPGRAFGKLYIRAYAEALGFDPRPLIEAYDRRRGPAKEGETASPPEESGAPRRAREAVAVWRQAMMGERQRARARAALPGAEAADGHVPAAHPGFGAGAPETDLPDAAELPGPPPGTFPDAPVALEIPPSPWVAAPDASPQSVGMSGWTRAAVAAFVFVGLFSSAAAVYYTFLRRGIEASDLAVQVPEEPAAPAVPAAEDATAGSHPEPPPPHVEPPAKQVRRPRPAARPAPPAVPSSMSITESGLGRRVGQRRLIEPGNTFPEGSVVWFSTRVAGGVPGERIRHVWIRDGRTVQSIPLRIGARDWRTHSRKTVYGLGPWAVEARDESGRVLARAEFTCGPESS
jgi:transcriptional regulator with XRE-family HTH domain